MLVAINKARSLIGCTVANRFAANASHYGGCHLKSSKYNIGVPFWNLQTRFELVVGQLGAEGRQTFGLLPFDAARTSGLHIRYGLRPPGME